MLADCGRPPSAAFLRSFPLHSAHYAPETIAEIGSMADRPRYGDHQSLRLLTSVGEYFRIASGQFPRCGSSAGRRTSSVAGEVIAYSHGLLLCLRLASRGQGRAGAGPAYPPGRPAPPFHAGLQLPGAGRPFRQARYVAVPHSERGCLPGPYTFLLHASRETPRRLQHEKRRTIGVRIPDHPVPLMLLEELGEPIMSSTLLLPDEPQPLTRGIEIQTRLEHDLDAVLDGGDCGVEPTTVVDLSMMPPGRGAGRQGCPWAGHGGPRLRRLAPSPAV